MSNHIINQLKNSDDNNEVKTKIYRNKLCVNEYTNMPYTFMKGSVEEKSLYRVMPLDGNEKIYFDSKDEYEDWKFKRKVTKIGRPYTIQGVSIVNK